MIHSLLRRFWCDCFICHSLRANHSFDFLGDLPIENLATSFSRKTWRHLWIVKNCNCSDIPPMRNSLGAFAFWQCIDCEKVGKIRKVGKRKMWKKLSAWFDYPPIRANIVWRGHSIEDESHISQQRLLFRHLSDLFFTEEKLDWRCQNLFFPCGENKYYNLHLFSTFQTNQMRLNLLIFDVSL